MKLKIFERNDNFTFIGISLYNLVQEAYGLPRKKTWNEVTNSKYVQDILQLLYPDGPDTAEAYVGALCEDHLAGSNLVI